MATFNRMVLVGAVVAIGACARQAAVDVPVIEPISMEPVPDIAIMTQELSSQDDPAAIVRRQLARQATIMESTGSLLRTDIAFYGALDDDSAAVHAFAIADSGRKTFIWACDRDCADMDFRVLDEAGRVLSDTVLIQEETISFTARRSGRYRVQVLMKACHANPCYYGVQLFAKKP